MTVALPFELELGCTTCKHDILLRTSMVSQNPNDQVALWIVSHYRVHHPERMDQFQRDYLRFLFVKIGMPLP